ncbi:MAG: UvrD-helicase domain-containing protein, partial [Pseudomonadota bacterium]
MRAEELERADDQARRDALDTGRSFIVQAPAGSGKTELLIQRYLKLLALVDTPEEVIAITFTRKAAAEMRARVLDSLARADGDPAELAAHERITQAAAQDVLARDARLDWHVRSNPQRLRIQTLDSLNASLSRMLPITAAANVAGNAVADDAQLRVLYRDAAAATLDWIGSVNPYRESIERLLAHLDNDTGQYVAYLADMLGRRDQWMPFVGSGQLAEHEFLGLRKSLESDLAGIAALELARLEPRVSAEQRRSIASLGAFAAANLIDEGRGDHLICQLAEPPGGLDGWLAVADLLLTKGGTWRARLTKGEGFPPGAKAEKAELLDLMTELDRDPLLRSLLHGLRGLPPDSYDDRQWEVLVALVRTLPLAVAELRALFARRAATDFIEIAQAADDALGPSDSPSDLLLLLDHQVKHLLVDEMQDTSLAQYELIRSLTRGFSDGDGRTLFCVGDPMQSVYRFRNAEVAQFLAARDNGIGDLRLTPLTLRRNFRSGEGLVDWYNAVFPSVLPAEDDPTTGAVAYAPAVAAEMRRGYGNVAVHLSHGSSRAAEAETACTLIRDLLDAHPGDSVAVLVRGRTVLPDLLGLLRQAAIAYQAVDIDRLTDLPELIELLALTRAAVHPADRQAWLALLRSPWIGLDWQDLHALVKNDGDASVWELLHDEHRRAALSDTGRELLARALPALAELRRPRRFESLRDVVERVWLRLGGPVIAATPDAIDNAYRLFEVISRLEQAATLDDVAELEAELDQERVSTTADSRLSIMTMHKSKGLQFDHVVLYGLGRTSRAADSNVLSWFELPPGEEGPRRLLAPVGPKAEVEKDPLHQFIRATAAKRDRLETGRLLYVACTRARKSLHLVGNVRMSEDGDEVKPPDPRSLLSLLWASIAEDVCASRRSADVPEDDDGAVLVSPVLRRFDSPWSVPELQMLSPTGLRRSRPGSNADVGYEWVGADARLAGTVVHRWLQHVARGRAELEGFSNASGRACIDGWLHELVPSVDSRAGVARRVREALETMSDDDQGQWLLTGDGYAELSLTGIVDGELQTGVIDRVRIDGATHWIVDYKTSSHEGGNLEGFLLAQSERYGDQLRRYKSLYDNYASVDARCAL